MAQRNQTAKGAAPLTDAERANTKDANIGATSTFEASGAFQEEGAKAAVDVDHPAVDNNPRSGTTVGQNRVEFNDPTLSAEQATAQALGLPDPVEARAEAAAAAAKAKAPKAEG